jgi:hypothetical protein
MMSVLNEETIQESTVVVPSALAEKVEEQPSTTQFWSKEVLVKKTTSGDLKLTNYRLTWKDSDTIVVLPVDAIDFIGYKRQTNWGLLIFGILMIFAGMGSFAASRSDNQGVGFLIMAVGGLLAFLSIKKFIVFATSGGEMLLKSDVLEKLDEWIDAVSAERDKLKYGV